MDKGSLVVEKVSAGYRNRPLLRDVSFIVERGAAIGLRGPSGCGKSTLLRTLAGLMDPIAGRVEFGERPAGVTEWCGFRARVLYVAQQPAFVEGSVRENLVRPFGYGANRGARWEETKARESIEAFGLEQSVLCEPAATLSIGQRQRVALVRALLLEPSILLLDEPTGALDADSRGAVEERLRAGLCHSEFGIVLVSHDTDQIDRLGGTSMDLRDCIAESAA